MFTLMARNTILRAGEGSQHGGDTTATPDALSFGIQFARSVARFSWQSGRTFLNVLVSRVITLRFSVFEGNRTPIIPDVVTMTIARNVVVPHVVRFI